MKWRQIKKRKFRTKQIQCESRLSIYGMGDVYKV